MDVTCKKARLRHAEKDRKYSTCKFADRVFHCVTKQIDDIITKGYWPKEAAPYRLKNTGDKGSTVNKQGHQTVAAAFIIHNSKHDILKCISIGIGTKFIDKSNTILHNGN